MTPDGRPVVVDGIRVGRTEALLTQQGREIRFDLRFRPYWPGVFHLMARLADRSAE
ncbi:hypothetical protein [Sphingobium sp.]|uniref:hypothetical protein n=1 Tax=Sphingobium sp. TaxID=1912891 RepID=UPI002E1F4F66